MKCFKTTTVGLRQVSPYKFESIEQCFKTTTVGLRQYNDAVAKSEFGKFQNHYGWIET